MMNSMAVKVLYFKNEITYLGNISLIDRYSFLKIENSYSQDHYGKLDQIIIQTFEDRVVF